MGSHEDAAVAAPPPPPYPGVQTQITSKGDYNGVPVYEIGSAHSPIFSPPIIDNPAPFPGHPVRIGRHPVHCVCPQCHQQIVTYVNYESGVFAWLMCLLLTVVGCVPCCVIPFCVSSCQDATHVCPHCSAVLGRHRVL